MKRTIVNRVEHILNRVKGNSPRADQSSYQEGQIALLEVLYDSVVEHEPRQGTIGVLNATSEYEKIVRVCLHFMLVLQKLQDLDYHIKHYQKEQEEEVHAQVLEDIRKLVSS